MVHSVCYLFLPHRTSLTHVRLKQYRLTCAFYRQQCVVLVYSAEETGVAQRSWHQVGLHVHHEYLRFTLQATMSSARPATVKRGE